jgi:hypothetical protein
MGFSYRNENNKIIKNPLTNEIFNDIIAERAIPCGLCPVLET